MKINVHLTRTHKNLLIKTGMLLIVLLLCFAFLILPRKFKKDALSNEVQDLQRGNVRIQNAVAISHDFGERLHDILKTLKHYKAKLVPRAALPDVLDDIGSKAQENHLEVKFLQVLGEEDGEPPAGSGLNIKGKTIEEVVVGMNARGKFGYLGRYLSALERAPYAILIKDVDLMNKKIVGPESRIEPVLDIDLKLVVLMTEASDKSAQS